MTLSLEVERSEFYPYLIRELQQFDKTLEKNLSNRISAAAKPVIADMRKAVKGVSSQARFEGLSAGNRSSRSRGGGGARARADFEVRNATRNAAEAVETGKTLLKTKTWDNRRLKARGLRDQIARGVRLSNVKRGRLAGVYIRSSSTKLPGDQKALPRAFDRGKWRHPFFGNRDFWVEQTVRPAGWFTQTGRKAKPKLYAEIQRAIDDAVMELAKAGRQ